MRRSAPQRRRTLLPWPKPRPAVRQAPRPVPEQRSRWRGRQSQRWQWPVETVAGREDRQRGRQSEASSPGKPALQRRAGCTRRRAFLKAGEPSAACRRVASRISPDLARRPASGCIWASAALRCCCVCYLDKVNQSNWELELVLSIQPSCELPDNPDESLCTRKGRCT